jgi:hypothetical protein
MLNGHNFETEASNGKLSDTDLKNVSGGQTINPASPAGTGVYSYDDDGYQHDSTKNSTGIQGA